MASRHITAAEVRHQQKNEGERERERLNASENKERNASQHRKSERELEIFSMMRFDSTTSSFLNLLVFQSYRKN